MQKFTPRRNFVFLFFFYLSINIFLDHNNSIRKLILMKEILLHFNTQEINNI